MPSPQLIDSNNYNYNSDSKNGVYIIHGFTNSTYETKDLAHYLGEQGFYTVANNLPGHGTTAEDCNRCKYADWIDFVEQGVAEMSSHCDNVYVVGISMGSVLTLLYKVYPVRIFTAITILCCSAVSWQIICYCIKSLFTKVMG
jgi:carboxylesterase